MSWKVRHEGSPNAVEGLSLAEVAEGLQDGRWDPTDEVMGPEEGEWVPIESHPQLEEVAAEVEPPPPRHYDDETRLDMNPLIDVCLVLLVFFILVTTYTKLLKEMEAGDVTSQKVAKATVITEPQQQQMIFLTVQMENGKPVYRVEGQVVPANKLVSELRTFVDRKHNTDLLLECADDVPWEDALRAQDAAKAARMDRIHYVVKENKG
jgi:biopolymer transport protein ExbD